MHLEAVLSLPGALGQGLPWACRHLVLLPRFQFPCREGSQGQGSGQWNVVEGVCATSPPAPHSTGPAEAEEYSKA